MALTTELYLKLTATLTGTAGLLTPQAPLSIANFTTMIDGTGSGAADKMYAFTNTLSASGTTDLDLVSTATDNLGTALGFARIKLLYVAAASGNTNNVNVTRPASNGVPLFLAAGDGFPVKPGGKFVWVAPDATGIAVTASTGDLITFTNSSSGTPVTYDVVVVGASA